MLNFEYILKTGLDTASAHELEFLKQLKHEIEGALEYGISSEFDDIFQILESRIMDLTAKNDFSIRIAVPGN